MGSQFSSGKFSRVFYGLINMKGSDLDRVIAKFREMCTSDNLLRIFMSRPQFNQLFNIEAVTSVKIFQIFCRSAAEWESSDKISSMDVLCAIILASRNPTRVKVKYISTLFDSNNDGFLNPSEVSLALVCALRGFRFLKDNCKPCPNSVIKSTTQRAFHTEGIAVHERGEISILSLQNYCDVDDSCRMYLLNLGTMASEDGAGNGDLLSEREALLQELASVDAEILRLDVSVREERVCRTAITMMDMDEMASKMSRMDEILQMKKGDDDDDDDSDDDVFGQGKMTMNKNTLTSSAPLPEKDKAVAMKSPQSKIIIQDSSAFSRPRNGRTSSSSSSASLSDNDMMMIESTLRLKWKEGLHCGLDGTAYIDSLEQFQLILSSVGVEMAIEESTDLFGDMPRNVLGKIHVDDVILKLKHRGDKRIGMMTIEDSMIDADAGCSSRPATASSRNMQQAHVDAFRDIGAVFDAINTIPSSISSIVSVISSSYTGIQETMKSSKAKIDFAKLESVARSGMYVEPPPSCLASLSASDMCSKKQQTALTSNTNHFVDRSKFTCGFDKMNKYVKERAGTGMSKLSANVSLNKKTVSTDDDGGVCLACSLILLNSDSSSSVSSVSDLINGAAASSGSVHCGLTAMNVMREFDKSRSSDAVGAAVDGQSIISSSSSMQSFKAKLSSVELDKKKLQIAQSFSLPSSSLSIEDYDLETTKGSVCWWLVGLNEGVSDDEANNAASAMSDFLNAIPHKFRSWLYDCANSVIIKKDVDTGIVLYLLIVLRHRVNWFETFENILPDPSLLSRSIKAINVNLKTNINVSEWVKRSEQHYKIEKRVVGPQDDELGKSAEILHFSQLCRNRLKQTAIVLESVPKMTSEELKKHLSIRGLTTRGLNSVLRARLTKALNRQMQVIGRDEMSGFGESTVADMFKKFDVDQDGLLSLSEMNNYHRQIGATAFEDMADYVQATMDSQIECDDKTGFVTLPGLLAYYDEHGGIADDAKKCGIFPCFYKSLSLNLSIAAEVDRFASQSIKDFLFEQSWLSKRTLKLFSVLVGHCEKLELNYDFESLRDLFSVGELPEWCTNPDEIFMKLCQFQQTIGGQDGFIGKLRELVQEVNGRDYSSCSRQSFSNSHNIFPPVASTVDCVAEIDDAERAIEAIRIASFGRLTKAEREENAQQQTSLEQVIFEMKEGFQVSLFYLVGRFLRVYDALRLFAKSVDSIGWGTRNISAQVEMTNFDIFQHLPVGNHEDEVRSEVIDREMNDAELKKKQAALLSFLKERESRMSTAGDKLKKRKLNEARMRQKMKEQEVDMFRQCLELVQTATRSADKVNRRMKLNANAADNVKLNEAIERISIERQAAENIIRKLEALRTCRYPNTFRSLVSTNNLSILLTTLYQDDFVKSTEAALISKKVAKELVETMLGIKHSSRVTIETNKNEDDERSQVSTVSSIQEEEKVDEICATLQTAGDSGTIKRSLHGHESGSFDSFDSPSLMGSSLCCVIVILNHLSRCLFISLSSWCSTKGIVMEDARRFLKRIMIDPLSFAANDRAGAINSLKLDDERLCTIISIPFDDILTSNEEIWLYITVLLALISRMNPAAIDALSDMEMEIPVEELNVLRLKKQVKESANEVESCFMSCDATLNSINKIREKIVEQRWAVKIVRELTRMEEERRKKELDDKKTKEDEERMAKRRSRQKKEQKLDDDEDLAILEIVDPKRANLIKLRMVDAESVDGNRLGRRQLVEQRRKQLAERQDLYQKIAHGVIDVDWSGNEV